MSVNRSGIPAGKKPYDLLRRSIRGIVRTDEPMAGHTTYRIGGCADLFVEPLDLEDLQTVMRFLHEYDVFGLWLGAGSNLLISDQGIRGVVIRLGGFRGRVHFDGRQVLAGAALPLGRLVRAAAEKGLGGVTFLAGIPGTVGGGVKMNAGAFGGELGARVEEVEVLTRAGEHAWLHRRDLSFSYRAVKGLGESMVLSARLLLEPADSETVLQERRRLQTLRREKQPMDQRSCGSVFKGIPDTPSPGELIEKAGCKGMRLGQAEVSRKHANFIVNLGGATGTDVWRLIREVQRRVQERFGLSLPLEVEPVGAFPEDGEG
jgi:UDP-N-acetylmuramate dehydrogenase